MSWRVITGDCVPAMRDIPEASIDAIVTDGPYGLEFMGKEWDGADGFRRSLNRADVGRENVFGRTSRTSPEYRAGPLFQEWTETWAREALRVLKPGGHVLSFGAPRTYHRMACGLEDAGAEIRDSLHWVYGEGMPHGLNVGKAIDRYVRQFCVPSLEAGVGWNTDLKPAHEPIVLARKEMDGTVVENVLEHGVGGLNIEATRVGLTKRVPGSPSKRNLGDLGVGWGYKATEDVDGRDPNIGRWPPNLLLTHSPACNGACAPGCPVAEMDRQSGEAGQRGDLTGAEPSMKTAGIFGKFAGRVPSQARGDTGGASRFFPSFTWDIELDLPFLYCPKPARAEREAGCHDLPRKFLATMGDGIGAREHNPDEPAAWARNHHPTVKPVALMQWLCRLVTPPGGTVLDPFTGSGSTGAAAVREGFSFVGIEREPEYAAIAERRIALAANAPKARPLGDLEQEEPPKDQLGLFGGGE